VVGGGYSGGRQSTTTLHRICQHSSRGTQYFILSRRPFLYGLHKGKNNKDIRKMFLKNITDKMLNKSIFFFFYQRPGSYIESPKLGIKCNCIYFAKKQCMNTEQ